MARRRTGNLLAALLIAAGLAGCSDPSDRAPVAAGRDAGTATSTIPVTPTIPVPPPAGVAPGRSFAVGVRELLVNRDDRALPVTIWYPATGGTGGAPSRDRKAADGRFPVVIFSHGLSARPADYQPLLAHWAAAGFVVAAPTYPHTSRGVTQFNVLDVLNQPADASYVLTRVLALDGRDGDVLRGRLATDRVAAAGHSAGGVTTIGLFTVGRDPRLDAGVVLAGSALGVGTAFAGTAAPQLYVHGERDDVVAYTAGKAAYDQVPWPKAMLRLPKGDHGRSLLRRGDPAFAVVSGTTVEFLRWSLYGDPAAKRRMAADAVSGGIGILDDHL